MQKPVEVENAQKLTTESMGWNPGKAFKMKKDLQQSHALANQVLDKKFEELKAGAPAEAKQAYENSLRLREEALQLFVKADKMFNPALAKEASQKILESWELGLKVLELAETAKV
jgi:hypothetical protein